ncbi:vesicle-associated membrane protein 2-like [Musca vetustissima]|uniref:vesicle-associated membrane protein 2-like n=1 Tax=Musca vetustissima TaxID=27455 RepID=UPI002AB727B5|nr:vesicle-associated membrane protein 2-like [Musca vetustissima]XP_061393498.1 vesicle-associated membrane protein 2-like [Musca vetustissima]
MATDTKINIGDDQLYENVYYSKNISVEADYRTPELLKQTQKQADEIVEIMYNNVNKVMDRQEKLEDLNATAEALQAQAATFQTTAVTLKREKWWSHMKTKIIIAIIIAIILIILIATLVSSFSGS